MRSRAKEKGAGLWDFVEEKTIHKHREKQLLGKHMFAMPGREVFLMLKEVIFGNSFLPGTGSLSKFFQAGKGNIKSLSESFGFLFSLAQNNGVPKWHIVERLVVNPIS